MLSNHEYLINLTTYESTRKLTWFFDFLWTLQQVSTCIPTIYMHIGPRGTCDIGDTDFTCALAYNDFFNTNFLFACDDPIKVIFDVIGE